MNAKDLAKNELGRSVTGLRGTNHALEAVFAYDEKLRNILHILECPGRGREIGLSRRA